MILREHPLIDPTKDLPRSRWWRLPASASRFIPSVPAQNLKELIDYVKANPGKLSYGSAGAGTMNHLSGEMLKSLTGITDLPHVPYRGAGPALADVIGGQIPMIIPAMTSQVLEFHRTGKLRLLAITNPIRLPVAPEIPTAVEAGRAGSRHAAGARHIHSGRRCQRMSSPRSTRRTAPRWRDKTYTQSLIDAAVIPATDWTPAKFNEFMKAEVVALDPAGQEDRGPARLNRQRAGAEVL